MWVGKKGVGDGNELFFVDVDVVVVVVDLCLVVSR